MHSTPSSPRLGSRRQPEESRAAIMHAAVREFSQQGLAGARTDAIARSAHVNKALLYYYFKDKESLYDAVLDEVFSGLQSSLEGVFARDLPPREKLLAYAELHFDYIARHPLYQRLVQAEMSRAGRGNTTHLERVANQYFKPLFFSLNQLIREGQKLGEFREVDPWHFVPSMIALITFYFNSAPVVRMMTGEDPLSPNRLGERRAAVLDYISAAIFVPHENSEKVRKGEPE